VLETSYGAAAGAPPIRSLRLADVHRGVDSVPALTRVLQCDGVYESLEALSLADWALEGGTRGAELGAKALPTYATIVTAPTARLTMALHGCRNLQALCLRSCALGIDALGLVSPLLLQDLKELDFSYNQLWVPHLPMPLGRGGGTKGRPAAKKAAAGSGAATSRTAASGRGVGDSARASASVTATLAGTMGGPPPPPAGWDTMVGAVAGSGEETVVEEASNEWYRALQDLLGKAATSFGDVTGGVKLQRGAAVLACALMSQFTRLQNLDMSHCGMSDEVGIPLLAAIADAHSLVYLDISHNR